MHPPGSSAWHQQFRYYPREQPEDYPAEYPHFDFPPGTAYLRGFRSTAFRLY
jgi:hypothetical protein